jgi:hypothetical protein
MVVSVVGANGDSKIREGCPPLTECEAFLLRLQRKSLELQASRW